MTLSRDTLILIRTPLWDRETNLEIRTIGVGLDGRLPVTPAG
jgi:hypothetical protein